MPIKPIDEVEPGDVLINPIQDSMGRVLIQQGEAITEQLLNVLKRRGYVEIDVKSPEGSGVSASYSQSGEPAFSETISGDEDVKRMKEELESRFHNVEDTDREMIIVKNAAENVLTAKIASKKGLS